MRLIIRDYKHWRFKYELMRFGVLLMVVTVFWVAISVYTSYTSTTVPKDYTEKTTPLNPALDLDVLQSLEGRVDPSEGFVPQPQAGAPESAVETGRTSQPLTIVDEPENDGSEQLPIEDENGSSL